MRVVQGLKKVLDAAWAGKEAHTSGTNLSTGLRGWIYESRKLAPGVMGIYYWGTLIVRLDKEAHDVTLYHKGYTSKTTVAVLNGALHTYGLKYYVYARKGKLIINGPAGTREFVDGLSLALPHGGNLDDH